MDIQLVFEQIFKLYAKLTNRQRYIIIGAIVSVISFISFVVVYSGGSTKNISYSEPDGYAMLYRDIDQKDAGLIVQSLQQDGVDYIVRGEGTIFVRKDKVAEERVKLAAAGLPKEHVIPGFELFDKREFGATKFEEQIKYLRAIEGELAKAITGLKSVDSAKVHIALAKETVFVDKQIPATASIVLTLAPNMVLSPKQVRGIKMMISSAVPGLNPENVSVVDESGSPLGDTDDLSQSKELAVAQMKYKKAYEKALEDKIVNVLTPIIGTPDQVVAKVTVEFNFDQRQSVEEKFDPNSVVRSEQSLEEKREGAKPKEIGGVPGAVSNIGPVQGLEDNSLKEKYSKNQTTTNYEVGKTTSNVKGAFATVRRITAAVVVDGKYNVVEGDNGEELKFKPLTKEQLAQIRDLVDQSIGFNQGRGDKTTVSNFQFDATIANFKPVTLYDKFKRIFRDMLQLLKYIVVAIIIFIFYKKVIVPFSERMLEIEIEDDEEDWDNIFDLDDDDENELAEFNDMRKKVEDQLGLGGRLSEDEIKYEVLVEKIKDIVTERPQDVAQLFTQLVRDELGLAPPPVEFGEG